MINTENIGQDFILPESPQPDSPYTPMAHVYQPAITQDRYPGIGQQIPGFHQSYNALQESWAGQFPEFASWRGIEVPGYITGDPRSSQDNPEHTDWLVEQNAQKLARELGWRGEGLPTDYLRSGQVGQAPPGGEEFPYPLQWGTASDVLTDIAQTGMPGITPEYAEQAWLPYQRQGQQESMQAREQAGLEGLRWSTPLAGQFEDIWGGASERFGAEMERLRLGDIQGQRQAKLSATGQLAGLGEQYAQLPLDVTQRMMGMGGLLQGMQGQEISPLLQEFLRTQPEYSPLLQMMFSGATGFPTGPSTYGQSTGGSIMNLLSMLAMFGLM